MYIYIHMYVHIYMYVCINIYTYIYIYIHVWVSCFMMCCLVRVVGKSESLPLQRVAVYCSVLQCVAVCCSVLRSWRFQFLLRRCKDLWRRFWVTESLGFNFSLIIKLLFTYTPQETRFGFLRPHTATHCNTLQHTATHCNTLKHTATHCNTLQHTATHCNTLQHTSTGKIWPWDSLSLAGLFAVCCSVLQCVSRSCSLFAVCCSVLQVSLQCGAVWCIVLPDCVGLFVVCCSALSHVADFFAVWCSVLQVSLQWVSAQSQCVAVCCGMLQCVLVSGRFVWSALQYVALSRRSLCSALQCVTVCCSVSQVSLK